MIVIAVDTGRGMRCAMKSVIAGVRAFARRSRAPVTVAALGDYRCHLLQTGDRFHVCGLDRSFELAMLYFARRGGARTLVFCGNGPVRDAISANHARMLGLACDEHVYTTDALRELRTRTSVRMLYVSRGVYDTGVREWETLLGKRNVAALDDARGTARALASLIRRRAHG